MTGEDFAVSLEVERHDEATQSSLAALDAEEACLEDTIRAGIARDIRAYSDQLTEGIREPVVPTIRLILAHAAEIASGATL